MTIHEILLRLRQRQRLLNMLRCAAHGALLGAVASAMIVGVAWAAASFAWVVPAGPEGAPAGPLGDAAQLWALLAIPLAVVGGAVVGALLPIDDLAVARALDRAAASEDRFASAVALAAHPEGTVGRRADRVRLIAADAVAHVQDLPATKVIPLRTPRSTRWALLPLAVLAVLLIIAPQRQGSAETPTENEITNEQWSELHKEFADELARLPKPETEQEKALRKELENLASMLDQKPAKREALREIARLSDRIEQHRRSLSTRDINMRNAAKAMARSEALKKFASLLKQGEYQKAATEMQAMSEQLQDEKLSPDAKEFESIAADMERLAQEMAQHPEGTVGQDLQDACQACANAAGAMNRESLSEAMRRLAEQLKQNAQQMQQCDSANQMRNLLEQLKRRMNQCSQCNGCKGGCSQCNGNGLCQGNKPGNRPGSGGGKGGLKAGWGSAAKWDGGQLGDNAEDRQAELANPLERSGNQTSFRIVSPDERAASSMSYEELYAEFVQKAEADLELEAVPVAQREFLRRYFNAIRPQESAGAEPDDG